jgi:hypothetical protein|tara:strand:- start:543 stop:923 length:381 start_codon:yes stop_codon:yes gene_type:complete
VNEQSTGASDTAIPLLMLFIMLFATNTDLVMAIEDSPIWQGQIPYDCAYLEGEVYSKVEFSEPINGQYHGLLVNVTVDNTTSYDVGITTSEVLYDLAEVGGQYRANTCKMADIHQMIEDGNIWSLA